MAFLLCTLPPALQINPAVSTALSIDFKPCGLFEFELTRQPGAVSHAFFSNSIDAIVERLRQEQESHADEARAAR